MQFMFQQCYSNYGQYGFKWYEKEYIHRIHRSAITGNPLPESPSKTRRSDMSPLRLHMKNLSTLRACSFPQNTPICILRSAVELSESLVLFRIRYVAMPATQGLSCQIKVWSWSNFTVFLVVNAALLQNVIDMIIPKCLATRQCGNTNVLGVIMSNWILKPKQFCPFSSGEYWFGYKIWLTLRPHA